MPTTVWPRPAWWLGWVDLHAFTESLRKSVLQQGCILHTRWGFPDRCTTEKLFSTTLNTTHRRISFYSVTRECEVHWLRMFWVGHARIATIKVHLKCLNYRFFKQYVSKSDHILYAIKYLTTFWELVKNQQVFKCQGIHFYSGLLYFSTQNVCVLVFHKFLYRVFKFLWGRVTHYVTSRPSLVLIKKTKVR